MAFFHGEIYSKSLEMSTAVHVILPEEGAPSQAKVLYLLHGLTDNCSGWTRYTSVERYARERNIAVVLPEVQRSWYCDMRMGLDYFRYVSKELPRLCNRFFGLSMEREKNYIAGLSMGGFGALKTAFTYPERYAGVGSFSGALGIKRLVEMNAANVLRRREAVAILGEELTVGAENDLEALASALSGATAPKIYLSCGEQDAMYPFNNALHEQLDTLGIAHRYDHRPGDHNWAFWDQSIQDCMAYLEL